MHLSKARQASRSYRHDVFVEYGALGGRDVDAALSVATALIVRNRDRRPIRRVVLVFRIVAVSSVGGLTSRGKEREDGQDERELHDGGEQSLCLNGASQKKIMARRNLEIVTPQASMSEEFIQLVGRKTPSHM